MQFKGVMCEIWATITRVTGSCRYFANRVEYLSVENPFDAHFIRFYFMFSSLLCSYVLHSTAQGDASLVLLFCTRTIKTWIMEHYYMEAIYSGYDSGDEKTRQAGTVGEKKVCRGRIFSLSLLPNQRWSWRNKPRLFCWGLFCLCQVWISEAVKLVLVDYKRKSWI